MIGFNFSDTPPAPFWYQQFMPSIGNRQINDVTFLDSLTGYSVTNNLSPGDTGYVLRTTNMGDNWNVNFTLNKNLQKVKFINANTGFICGGSGGGTAYLAMTTNAGSSWTSVTTPGGAMWKDMSVLNKDTLWIVDDDGLVGGVFRTTNGGVSWQQQPVPNMDHIYMYNRNIGFVTNTQVEPKRIYKTTDSGQNWNLLNTGESFNDVYFINSLTGWRAWGSVKMTTDGGLNWQSQVLPSGLGLSSLFATRFAHVNTDTIWIGGGRIIFPNSQARGILFRTTNGGSNWLFQVPDTTIHSGVFSIVIFANRNIGWANAPNAEIHTTAGGDTTWYVGIQQISSEVPQNYELKQNYPNPFNPRTVIPYSLKKSAYVRMIAYDILGREAQVLVDQKQQAGEYEVDFMGKFAASGVYFYQMTISNEQSSEVFKETKKMLMIK